MFVLSSVTADFPFLVPAVVGIAVVLGLLFVVWTMYKVAESNEALIISGFAVKGSAPPGVEASLDFKIVPGGKGSLVLPVIQTARSLPLDLRRVNIELVTVSSQSIPVVVKAVVIFKVADDFASIANAARRFLGKDDEMEQSVKELALGQLRTIIGSMQVEDLIREREKFRSIVVESCKDEMTRLGLTVDSFQIQDIQDPHTGDADSGYIRNLGRPQAAQVARDARIAEADRLKEATEREQAAKAEMAEATKASEVRQAQAKAETETAQAKAEQAGPLAEAQARQQVIEAETKAQELEAELEEKRLNTQVRKPADARAYEQVTLAEADRQATIAAAQAQAEQVKLSAQAQAEATKLNGQATAEATKVTGQAEGEAIRAKATAEADGIKARNEALATNAEAVINQQIAENLPQITEAAARQFDNIDQLIVLDGAEGLSKTVAGSVAAAGPLFAQAKNLIHGVGESAANGSPANGKASLPVSDQA